MLITRTSSGCGRWGPWVSCTRTCFYTLQGRHFWLSVWCTCEYLISLAWGIFQRRLGWGGVRLWCCIKGDTSLASLKGRRRLASGLTFFLERKKNFSTFYKLPNFLVQPPLSLNRPTTQFFFPVKALVGTSCHCKLPTNLGNLGGTLWKLGCFLFHHRQQAYEKVPVARNSTNENAFSLI